MSILLKEEVLAVEMAEEEVEDRSSDEADNRWGSEAPDQVWILDGVGGGEGDGGGNCGHEEGERHHESLHVFWGARVGESVGGDVDEDFGTGGDRGRDGV